MWIIAAGFRPYVVRIFTEQFRFQRILKDVMCHVIQKPLMKADP